MLTFYSRSLPASNPSFWPDYWKQEPETFNEKFMPEYGAFRRHVPAGASVLDAGCGTGFATRAMRANGYRAFGIDYDQVSLTGSVRRRGYFPAAVATVTRLPYRNAAFDAVFLCSVAEHVPAGAGVALCEAARVLRPQGTLVLTLPYLNVVRKLYAPACRAAARFRGSVSFNQHVYTRREVIRMLREAGFQLVECRRSHYMTVLLRVPGFRALQRLLFGAAVAPTSTASIARASGPPPQSSVRPYVKRLGEALLNALISNRLTVVATRTRTTGAR